MILTYFTTIVEILSRFLVCMSDTTPQPYNMKSFVYSKLQLRIVSILECMDMDTFLISNDLKIIFANTAYLSASGFGIDDVVDHYCFNVVCNKIEPGQQPPDTCPIKQLIRTKKPLAITDVFLDKNGKKRMVTVATALIKIDVDEEACLYMVLPVKNEGNAKNEAERAFMKSQRLLDLIAQIEHQEREIRHIADDLAKTEQTLRTKSHEFDIIYKDTVDRELKMLELKKTISDLQNRLNQIGNAAA
jgi:hypothetical protein